jgi:hypothetical protein
MYRRRTFSPFMFVHGLGRFVFVFVVRLAVWCGEGEEEMRLEGNSDVSFIAAKKPSCIRFHQAIAR